MTKKYGELGVTGLEHYAGQVMEHWIAALNTSSKRIKVYDEMYRYDPTVAAMVGTTSMFMCNTEPMVETASTSRADMEAAEFLESALIDMTKSWAETMSDIVLFLPYGFFDMETVYWRRDGSKSQFDDGRIGWRKWAPRHPVTLFQWEFDAHGGLMGMIQSGPPNYKQIRIPIEKLLHFTTTGMGKNNPEGQSILDRGYASWFFAKNLTIQEAIIIERMGGTPFIKLPEGATTDSSADSDLERAKRVVRNIKTAEDMGLTLPAGFEFGYAVPSSGPAIDTGGVITRHRRDLARTLMMDFIMLGGGDQGSWAMHKDKSTLYTRGLNAYLKKIANVITRHGIPRLFDLNAFPGITGLPSIYFTPITKIDIGDFADVIATLFNSGALSYDMDTENQVRRQIGLREITELGITFKPPMSLIPSETQEPQKELEPEDEDDEEEEEGDTEAQEELSEFSENFGQHDAEQYSDRVAKLLMRDYDAFAQELAGALAEEEDENEWESIIALALAGLSAAMLRRLHRGLFATWNKETGQPLSIEGLRAILAVLEEQNGYIQDSLLPAIQERVVAERRRLKQEAAKKTAIALAIVGLLAAFRYRTSLYAGSVYAFWANFAHLTSIWNKLHPVAQKAGIELRRDWKTGRIIGVDVLARYEGPDDATTCLDCSAVMAMGWSPSQSIPPIGSLQCDGNCRHEIIYKLRGRIYR